MKLAEIDITGFSQYLHAIDDNKEMILAIGQETDDDGWILGLQVSLFDMRDDENTTVIRHSIELEKDTYSTSDALWDKNAIRFNKENGLLIIPISIHAGRQQLNGFKVFSISATAITDEEACTVDYTNVFEDDPSDIGLPRYCAWLPPVSFVCERLGRNAHCLSHKMLPMPWFSASHDL